MPLLLPLLPRADYAAASARTIMGVGYEFATVVQWIAYRASNPTMRVQVLPVAPITPI